VYLIAIIPAVLVGHPLGDLLTLTMSKRISAAIVLLCAKHLHPCKAIPTSCTDPSYVAVAFVVTGIAVAIYLFFLARSRVPLTRQRLLVLALTSVMLMPFCLPRMHDRYFNPADILALVVAFYVPRLRVLAITIEFASLLSYTTYMLGFSVIWPIFGAFLMS